MKRFLVLFSALFLLSIINVSAQSTRIISDCTVQYDLTIDDTKADAAFVKTMKGATKTVYIKGTRSRSDLLTPTYVQTIINDSKSDTTIVLRELGTTKYMSYLNQEKRQNQNKRFEGVAFNPTGETKTILGYQCTKVVAKLKDGSNFNVYYAPSIIPSNKEYEYQFKDLPGFVLEYETQTEDGKTKISYVASKIILTPVPESKFEVPKSGYRIL
jgi:GLPGLI family protein